MHDTLYIYKRISGNETLYAYSRVNRDQLPLIDTPSFPAFMLERAQLDDGERYLRCGI